MTCSARQSCLISSNTLNIHDTSLSSFLRSRLSASEEGSNCPGFSPRLDFTDLLGPLLLSGRMRLTVIDILFIGFESSYCGISSYESSKKSCCLRWSLRCAKCASGPG